MDARLESGDREVKRGARLGAVAVSLAALLAATDARSDISPPPGYEWLLDRRVHVVRVPADHLIVLWPCDDGPELSLEPYCVIRAGDTVRPNGSLWAIPYAKVETAPYRPKQPDPRARPGELVILKPRIAHHEADFFAKDPRVVRPGFSLTPSGFDRIVQNAGVEGAVHSLSVDRVGDRGIEARFVSAKYRCRDGKTVDVAWGPRQDQVPMPSCSVTNADEQRSADAGNPNATTEPPPRGASRSKATVSRQAIWLGVALGFLGLVGAGVLLVRNKRSN